MSRSSKYQEQEEEQPGHLLADVHQGDLVSSAGSDLGDTCPHQASSDYYHLEEELVQEQEQKLNM